MGSKWGRVSTLYIRIYKNSLTSRCSTTAGAMVFRAVCSPEKTGSLCYFFINSSTALVIPTMPVRMVGSGPGANLLECRLGNGAPVFLRLGDFRRIDCADIEHAGRDRMIRQTVFAKVFTAHCRIFLHHVVATDRALQRRRDALRQFRVVIGRGVNSILQHLHVRHFVRRKTGGGRATFGDPRRSPPGLDRAPPVYRCARVSCIFTSSGMMLCFVPP